MRDIALRLAAYAGASLGSFELLAPTLPRNALRLAAALEQRPPSVNLELVVGRALAVRSDVLTARTAEDLIRSCEAVLDDSE